MVVINILTSNLFLAVADRLMDLLWLSLAIDIKIGSDRGALAGVIMQMILLRVVFYLLLRKLFNKINFYGLYIFGLTAAFVIILIGTKNESITFLVFLVAVKEIFSMFRILGNKGVSVEVFSARRKIINAIRILPYAALVPAYLIASYYINNNVITSIFAALAILVGLPTIFIYNGFSKNYSKKGIEVIEPQNIKKRPIEVILNIISAASIPAFYAIFIFAKTNTLLFIGILSLLSIFVETLKAIIIKEKLNFELDTLLYSNIWLAGLLTAVFVV